MRTPWPSRSAPHHWIACQIDGRPKASPAWMVKWKFSRCRYSNASRCRVGGKPASAPAMSKPTTPVSRYRTASSAISCDRAACRIAVSSVPIRIVLALRGRLGAAVREAGVHRLDHLVQGQAALQVLLRRVPHLGVDDAVRGQVQRALPGDPVQRLLGLHHRDRVREGLQVAFQRPGVGRRDEPLPQPRRVGLGQLVPDRVGQLDDGRRPQPTVEVVVQQSLGGLDDVVVGDGDHQKTLEGSGR